MHFRFMTIEFVRDICIDSVNKKTRRRSEILRKLSSIERDHSHETEMHLQSISHHFALIALKLDVRMMILKQSKRRTLFRKRKFDVLIESI